MIKYQREKQGLSQVELADKLNTDKQYVWKLENGKVSMSLKYLDKTIVALNCKHEDFLVNNNNNPK